MPLSRARFPVAVDIGTLTMSFIVAPLPFVPPPTSEGPFPLAVPMVVAKFSFVNPPIRRRERDFALPVHLAVAPLALIRHATRENDQRVLTVEDRGTGHRCKRREYCRCRREHCCCRPVGHTLRQARMCTWTRLSREGLRREPVTRDRNPRRGQAPSTLTERKANVIRKSHPRFLCLQRSARRVGRVQGHAKASLCLRVCGTAGATDRECVE
jgi:hypothetical protein